MNELWLQNGESKGATMKGRNILSEVTNPVLLEYWAHPSEKLSKFMVCRFRLGLNLFNADICISNTNISNSRYRYLSFMHFKNAEISN